LRRREFTGSRKKNGRREGVHSNRGCIMRKGTLTVVLAVLCLGAPLAAQAAGTGASDHVAAIKESLQKSQAALHQYEWVETTVISIKGEEKSKKQDNCYYGADGTLEKVPIGGEPQQSEGRQRRGLRGRVVEHKKEEVSDSAKAAVALVKQYLPPDPSRIQAAKDAGNLSVVPPDAQGVVKVVIKNYLKQGDSLTMSANASTNRLTGVSVATYTDDTKDKVDLDVVFGTLDDGTVYQEEVDLDVASENLTATITNSGYKKMGS
jgi:hypothetical protein